MNHADFAVHLTRNELLACGIIFFGSLVFAFFCQILGNKQENKKDD